jgi:cytochrome c oxidase assembly protein subunit 15
MAFAFTLLLALVYTRFGSMLSSATTSLPSGVRWGIFSITIYSYAVVYLGAFVRHTESSGGCIGWPLCNGSVIPDLVGPTRIVFAHRLGAALLFILIAWLFIAIRSKLRPENNIYQAAKWALILVTLQIFSGAFVTLSIGYNSYLVASLLHAVLVSCLFGILCYLCVHAFQARKGNRQAYEAR